MSINDEYLIQSLLRRQLKKSRDSAGTVDSELFLKEVEQTYLELYRERRLADRSMALMSEELLNLNDKIKEQSSKTIREMSLALYNRAGTAYFESLVSHLAQTFDFKVSLICQWSPQSESTKTTSLCIDGLVVESESISLSGTPFMRVLELGMFHVSQGLQGSFSQCFFCKKYAIDSFLGIALEDELGNVIGLLALMDVKPFHNPSEVESVIKIVASRAEVELQRMQTVKSLQESREKAEAASQAKSRFLTNMSHEIRTPLNGVIGMLGLMEKSSLNSDQIELLTTAQSSAELLKRLISDILDFSRIEKNELEIIPESFQVEELIDGLKEFFVHTFRFKGLTLNVTKPLESATFLFGDALRVRQVLFNLLDNAIKFTPSGGAISLNVSLQSKSKRGVTLLFQIMDSGCGIPPEKLFNIFNPFDQADGSLTRSQGGTGLGLAISKRLAQLLGGSLSVSSDVGKGSRFDFLCPFEIELSDTNPVHSSDLIPSNLPLECLPTLTLPSTTNLQTEEAKYPTPQKCLKVLLAEDNAINAKITIRMLESEGHRVTHVINGKIALEEFKRNCYDIVLMDIQMPVMSGDLAFQKIRAIDVTKRIPVVAVTAHALLEEKEKLLAMGMDGYVTKPLEKEVLLKTIHSIFNNTKSTNEVA